MDNVPGRLELFIAPFSTLLQKLLAADFANSNMRVSTTVWSEA